MVNTWGGILMKRIIVLLAVFCTLAATGSFLTEQVGASNLDNATRAVTTQIAAKTAEECRGGHSFLIFPTWYKYLKFNDDCTIANDTTTDSGVSTNYEFIWLISFAVIEILLTLAGMVAVVFVMIGGFKFVTAQGSPDTLVSARKTLANAIVGAVIAIIAGRTVSFIANKLSTDSAGTVAGKNDWGLVEANTAGSFGTISNYALTILGALSVITIIVSGIQFMVSSANPDKVKKARSAIYFALTGLAVAILASAIINLVIKEAT
jgi:hypothetical protein